MRTTALILTATLVLGACGEDLPRRSIASQPIGSTATSGPTLSSQGAQDINRDYYIGADPNFPRGTSPGPRGIR